MKIVLGVVTITLVWVTSAWAQTLGTVATAELKFAQANQAQIESEIERNKEVLKRAQEDLARQQQFLAKGLIARRRVEQAEAAVRHQQTLLDLLMEQKKIAERVVALAQERVKLAQQQRALQLRQPSIQRVTNHYGRGSWNQRDLEKLARAFRQQFGRPLPISALGQTRTHRQLGFNHRQRMDIAVHPDDPEGQWIMDYLEEQGIPFIAFRSYVPGCATGAHIHVGLSSRRL